MEEAAQHVASELVGAEHEPRLARPRELLVHVDEERVIVGRSGARQIDSYTTLCYCGSTVDISDDGVKVVSTEGRQVRIVDVGLRPAHARRFNGLLVDPQPAHAALPAALQPLLDVAIRPDERAWLALHALELAAIRPEQVIKRLFRAMTRDSDGEGAGSDGGDGDSRRPASQPNWRR